MGFADLARSIVKYNRSLQHKENYFKSRKNHDLSWAFRRKKWWKLSREALSRIQLRQRKELIRILALIAACLLLAGYISWKLLF